MDGASMPTDVGLMLRDKHLLLGTFGEGGIAGRGLIKSFDDYYYRGDVSKNLYDGYGILVTVKSMQTSQSDADKVSRSPYRPPPHFFAGAFMQGLKHGYGVCFPLGDSTRGLESAFVLAHYVQGVADGFGFYNYPSYQFQGQLKAGLAEGFGKETTPKQKFHGQFSKGRFHGIGIAKYKGQSYYVGHWRDGKKEGFGEELNSKGDKFEGIWQAGVINGQVKITYAFSSLGSSPARDRTLE